MAHMRHLVEQLHKLEERLRAGGGAAKIERQHRAGKMTVRERIAALIDSGTPFLEIGLPLAYDQYDGEAPGLGSVTGIRKIEVRAAVIIAGDATVKAGSWWPETVTKRLRAQPRGWEALKPAYSLLSAARFDCLARPRREIGATITSREHTLPTYIPEGECEAAGGSPWNRRHSRGRGTSLRRMKHVG
jgi:acetyl-CoA carboxylase carboxyltransferase component